MEYHRQETIMSAKNLFQTATNALSTSSTLKKVIIMKHIPRYDPLSVDPLSLKPALSQLFNNTLTEEWMNGQYKENIVIGSHNIDCTGAIKEARYRETKTGKYDGIHLYGSSGRKAYTLSVLNILKSAKVTSSEHDYHQSCAQYKYQERQYRNRQQDNYTWKENRRNYKDGPRQQTQFILPTENRFTRLSGMNQGN